MNNWYIDFDSTLYDTSTLKKDMLETMALNINPLKKESIIQEIDSMFKPEKIYNIFKLCNYYENKYNLKENSLIKPIKEIILNGSKYVFNDVIPFLEKLRNNNNTISMLTWSTLKENMEFQNLKIIGSGISNYFDTLIITAFPKHTLELNYKTGIFIDDNTNDLENLYKISHGRVIRIKRKNNKYSKIPLNIPNIEEYSTLSEILI